MARESSILAELDRVDLLRAREAAGYSTRDADAPAGRIVDGWTTPGLAVALQDRGDVQPALAIEAVDMPRARPGVAGKITPPAKGEAA